MRTPLHVEKPRWNQFVHAGLYLPDKTDIELQSKPKYKKVYSQMSYFFVPLSVPLSLTHTALSITNSGNSRPPKM